MSHDLFAQMAYIIRQDFSVCGAWRVTGGGWRVGGDGWRVAGDGWRVAGGR